MSSTGMVQAGCLAVLLVSGLAQAADGPLKINQTQIRTVLRDREDGVQHEVIYRSNGPVLDERHLRRNLGDKPDGKVHISVTHLGDQQYQLTLQSLDTGRADRYHATVALSLPSRVSCDFGYWEIANYNEVRNDLADTPFFYATYFASGFRVALDKRVDGPFQFLGGQYQATFSVQEHCF